VKTYQIKVSLSLLILFLIGLGCTKIAENKEFREIDFLKFSDFGCPSNTPWHLNPTFNGELYFITSRQEFEECISIDYNPNIDFSNYSLLVGRKHFTSGAALLDEKVETNDSKLLYTVTFLIDETTVAIGVRYYAIIPKPPKSMKIEVKHIIKGSI